jgi:hypothetical protein
MFLITVPFVPCLGVSSNYVFLWRKKRCGSILGGESLTLVLLQA